MQNRFTKILKFYKKSPSMFDQALTSGGNFLTIAVCAHFLPMGEQGKFGYVYAFYMAVLFLNITSVFQWAAVQAPQENDKIQYLKELSVLQFLLIIFTSTLIAIFLAFFDHKIQWQISFTEAFLLFLFLFLQQFADFDRRTSYIFFSSETAFFSSLFLYPPRVLFLLAVQPKTLSGALILLCVSCCLPALRTTGCLVQGIKAISGISLKRIKEHLYASRHLILVAPFGWLWTFIPVFVLGALQGSAAVAILTAVRSLTNFANILMEQLETVVAAKLGKCAHEQGQSGLEALTKPLVGWGTAGWGVALIVFIFWGREILILIFGARYADYNSVLLILWVSYWIFFIARIYGMKYRFMKETRVELIGNICSVVCLLFISNVMIQKYAINGAAILLVLSSLTILITQIIFVRLLLFRKSKGYAV